MPKRIRGQPELTEQQRRVLGYIKAFMGAEGEAPTLEAIRRHLGLSAVSTVHEHVAGLIEKGYLSRDWNRARSIRLGRRTIAPGAARMIPLLGRVGRRFVAEPEPDRHPISVPEALGGSSTAAAVQVIGDALSEDGFCDGDTLIIEPMATTRSGQVALVQLGSGAVRVRRVEKRSRFVNLASVANPSESMRLKASNVKVLGTVIGLLRMYA